MLPKTTVLCFLRQICARCYHSAKCQQNVKALVEQIKWKNLSTHSMGLQNSPYTKNFLARTDLAFAVSFGAIPAIFRLDCGGYGTSRRLHFKIERLLGNLASQCSIHNRRKQDSPRITNFDNEKKIKQQMKKLFEQDERVEGKRKQRKEKENTKRKANLAVRD